MSINTTPNLELPQWTSNEKPSFLTEINGAWSSIDTAYGLMKSEQESLTTRQSAVEATAGNANTNATEAKQTADTALSTANEANGSAGNAIQTANNAQSTAVLAKNQSDRLVNSFGIKDVKSEITITDPNYTCTVNVALLSGNVLQFAMEGALASATTTPPGMSATISGVTFPSTNQWLCMVITGNRYAGTGILNGTSLRVFGSAGVTTESAAQRIDCWGTVVLDPAEADRLRSL